MLCSALLFLSFYDVPDASDVSGIPYYNIGFFFIPQSFFVVTVYLFFIPLCIYPIISSCTTLILFVSNTLFYHPLLSHFYFFCILCQ